MESRMPEIRASRRKTRSFTRRLRVIFSTIQVVRQDAGWTLFVKEPVAGLDGVDLGDEGPQIDVGRLPVLGSCLYHVEALAKTELKTNRYQGAGGEERGEKAALLQASDIAVHFLKQPVGVMVFGKADGRCHFTGKLVLGQEPGALKVP